MSLRLAVVMTSTSARGWPLPRPSGRSFGSDRLERHAGDVDEPRTALDFAIGPPATTAWLELVATSHELWGELDSLHVAGARRRFCVPDRRPDRCLLSRHSDDVRELDDTVHAEVGTAVLHAETGDAFA
jgi:hypothetical protein